MHTAQPGSNYFPRHDEQWFTMQVVVEWGGGAVNGEGETE